MDPRDYFSKVRVNRVAAGKTPPDRDSAGPNLPNAPSRIAQNSANPENRLGLHGQQPFPLHFLAGQFPRPAHGFRFLAGSFFGGLFVMTAELHLAENTLALHFLFERFESLIDIIVANENLHAGVLAVSPRHRMQRRP
jgi:hypothetical protein